MLAAESGIIARIFVLEDDIVRVAVLPSGDWRGPKTWAIAPGADDVAQEGRERLDLTGFSLPAYSCVETDEQLVIETGRIRLSVALQGFFCSWETRQGERWAKVARDRRTQAYNFGWWDDRIYHYLARDPQEKYFGLGERSGEMDRAGRRFRMTDVDAMGYSARTSDPLYKHVPFYITCRPDVAFGLFYDTLSDCTFDMGCERSNYHGLFRSFVADHGDLDYYFIAGADAAAVTRRFTWLTGRPAFMPRWSLGYSGSTMSYTDAPDAQTRMNEFLSQCEAHDILCDSFHLSSGYTSIGNKRYVFHWNRDKFPDPAAFVAHYRDKGVRLVPNIKPCLLRDHPLFAEAQALGLLVSERERRAGLGAVLGRASAPISTSPIRRRAPGGRRKSTKPCSPMAWPRPGTTTTSSKSCRRPRVSTASAKRARAIEAKPLQTLLMMRASRDAQVAHAPDKRPFLVTRAGGRDCIATPRPGPATTRRRGKR